MLCPTSRKSLVVPSVSTFSTVVFEQVLATDETADITRAQLFFVWQREQVKGVFLGLSKSCSSLCSTVVCFNNAIAGCMLNNEHVVPTIRDYAF